ncbi:MAG: hypothetical protein US40_C0002G0137 [Candidatus Roizmanbacteria bacterium GW2011_GWC2_37_13]|uniref:DUF711 domain-containing protein n=1 Tax=Candidatus Roizmanbacteria bacterium GW2011_GWC2_37_13 TaxID=1618486 RepID=A0A0G0G698_9BACT|nr:MAG: hypothetical protein US38_C0013G0018 [Candidatus Roizmanbacteria bacterium GW2011_GWC1_37_12]KKQ26603.1 MAG: hypothetical protein US40_C0002G0137 [Candidatus Roizmanbacteria bacterium GW2011_GWC2_37_13]
MNNKIIRSICLFEKEPSRESLKKLDELEVLLKTEFTIQTKRLCSSNIEKTIELSNKYSGRGYIFGIGTIDEEVLKKDLLNILKADIHFNLDLTDREINLDDIQILFDIIKNNPARTFNFAYEFNNPSSSPFFPSANYERDGFSIGLQPTDLAENCQTLDEWLVNMKNVWFQLFNQLKQKEDFLGIDSSIAPLFTRKSSFINFVKKLSGSFEKSTTTDIYTKITRFIKKENPKSTGLCGLMFPCLEDFELTEEYEKGNFNIERNIYLSLQSGVGIDTYPVGTDEKPERVLEILKLLKNLSNKFQKPLSARFVSDGKTKIGGKTDFKNQYLKDVVVKPL